MDVYHLCMMSEGSVRKKNKKISGHNKNKENTLNYGSSSSGKLHWL